MRDTQLRFLTATFLSATMTLVLCPQTQASADPTRAVHDLLYKQAEDAYPDADIEVSVAAFDQRLQLAACDELQVEARGSRVAGRIPVALKCLAPSPWSAFLSGEVKIHAPVLVTTQPLPRGTMLSAADLELQNQDISALRAMPLRDPQAATGLQLKRALGAGSVLYLSQIEQPLAVRRGEKVTVLAVRGAVQISVPGESLEDGRRGEQIRVRNRSSQKTIQVWVVGRGVVQTTAPAAGGAELVSQR